MVTLRWDKKISCGGSVCIKYGLLVGVDDEATHGNYSLSEVFDIREGYHTQAIHCGPREPRHIVREQCFIPALADLRRPFKTKIHAITMSEHRQGTAQSTSGNLMPAKASKKSAVVLGDKGHTSENRASSKDIEATAKDRQGTGRGKGTPWPRDAIEDSQKAETEGRVSTT